MKNGDSSANFLRAARGKSFSRRRKNLSSCWTFVSMLSKIVDVEMLLFECHEAEHSKSKPAKAKPPTSQCQVFHVHQAEHKKIITITILMFQWFSIAATKIICDEWWAIPSNEMLCPKMCCFVLSNTKCAEAIVIKIVGTHENSFWRNFN